MNQTVKCNDCGQVVVLNPNKHRFRPKLCPNCLTIIANHTTKQRVLSIFQQRKQQRKQQTRTNYISRMQQLQYGLKHISKRMVKTFSWEKE